MDKPQFEEQKTAIIEKAQFNLEQIKNNLDVLNRNLEVMNSIGLQFQAPARLWDSFHKAIGSSEGEKETENMEISNDTSRPVTETSIH